MPARRSNLRRGSVASALIAIGVWTLRLRVVRAALALAALAAADFYVVYWIAGSSGAAARVLFVSLYACCIAAAVYVVARGIVLRRMRVRAFADLLALSPGEFEEAVARMLRVEGYHDVRRVGGSGDLGADIVCRDRRGRLVVVQCKRNAPGIRIGSRAIQSFIGMMSVHHGADQGVFVTTSGYTQPAIDLAEEYSIMLIDGEDLGVMATRRGPRRAA